MVEAARNKTVKREDKVLVVFLCAARDAELIYSSVEHKFIVHNIHKFNF